MTWWQAILIMLSTGVLVFCAFWVGARTAKGEALLPKKPKPPPMPIYNTPADNNRIRKEARAAAEGVHYQVVP